MKCGECKHFVQGVKKRTSHSGKCKHGYASCTSENTKACKNCFEPKKQTNADRIRAMSDEELAHWICKRLPSCSVGTCPGAELCNGTDGLSNGLVKWLQQPCEAVQPITERPDGKS